MAEIYVFWDMTVLLAEWFLMLRYFILLSSSSVQCKP